MCVPWTASVGSYGTLEPRPDRETIIRAPEDGSLVSLNVRPGQEVRQGITLGRLENLTLQEQIAQLRAELARVNTESRQLTGELLVQRQEAVSARLRSNHHWREWKDVEVEEQQIRARLGSRQESGTSRISFSNEAIGARLPDSLATLEADADMRAAKLAEAQNRLQRSRRLFEEGILARSDLEIAEMNSSALTSDLSAARHQLSAALIEHARRDGTLESDAELSRSSIDIVRAQITRLRAQLDAMRPLTESLQEKLAILEHKQRQFVLLAPLSGVIFGEDLPRMAGNYFARGATVCRIADVNELLVRVQVPEREIGDLSVGQPVRLRTRAFPGRLFRGVVSRIAGESDSDSNHQATFRVELTIGNGDRLLRPGMTVFARIDFGRHSAAWILAHKCKQALRPEMWML